MFAKAVARKIYHDLDPNQDLVELNQHNAHNITSHELTSMQASEGLGTVLSKLKLVMGRK